MSRSMEYPTSHTGSQPDSSGLQAVPYPTLELHHDDGKIVTGYGVVKPEGGGGSTTIVPSVENISATQKKPNRRRYYTIGAIVAILVIIAAVMGGVFGSRKAESGDSASASSAPTSERNPTSGSNTASVTSIGIPGPTEIASNSRLAASAWQDNNGFVRHIFYQQANGTLRSCMATGSNSTDKAGWQNAKTIPTPYQAQNLTAIASGLTVQNVDNNGDAVQVEIFYLNTSSYINGMAYGRTFQYRPDSINLLGDFPALPGSDLATYWPFILYQNEGGLLQVIRYDSGWTSKTSSLQAERNSRFALIPTSRNVTDIGYHGRIAVLYQDEDGKLRAWEDPRDMDARVTYSSANPTAWNSSFPDIDITSKSSIAAFSVAASSDASNDEVHTFVLYHDKSGKIHQVWRDGVEGKWKSSTPDAFKDADTGTSISCVTGPTWLNVQSMSDRLLEPASNLTRCVFLTGGQVMETQLDGTDWKAPQQVHFESST